MVRVVAALLAAVATAVLGATAAAASAPPITAACRYTDACSKASISAPRGGFLVDSCRRAYAVSATCALSAVRVCAFKDPCKHLPSPRTMYGPSGGVVRSECGDKWTLSAGCKATPATLECRLPSTGCAAYPVGRVAGEVLTTPIGSCDVRTWVVGPGCKYTRVAKQCALRDACGRRIVNTWVGGVFVRCGKLYAVGDGCKATRL